jgi:hypothetical protein
MPNWTTSETRTIRSELCLKTLFMKSPLNRGDHLQFVLEIETFILGEVVSLSRVVKSLHRANVGRRLPFSSQVYLSAAGLEVNHGDPAA